MNSTIKDKYRLHIVRSLGKTLIFEFDDYQIASYSMLAYQDENINFSRAFITNAEGEICNSTELSHSPA